MQIIIIATPGRFLDLLRGDKIDIKPDYVILDEADEMLDMGFLDDIKEIFLLSYLKRDKLYYFQQLCQLLLKKFSKNNFK